MDRILLWFSVAVIGSIFIAALYLMFFLTSITATLSKELVYAYLISPRWERTMGEVKQSQLGPHCSSWRAHRNKAFQINIDYEYSVRGQAIIGHRVQFANPPCLPMDEAQEYLSQYRLGQQVSVYFDRDNPRDSVLVPGKVRSKSIALFWMFSLVFLLKCFLLFKLFVKIRRDMHNSNKIKLMLKRREFLDRSVRAKPFERKKD